MSDEVNYPLRLVKHPDGKLEWRDDEPGYVIGDRVEATRDIISPADDYSPAYVCARRGDILEVRATKSTFWECYVAHPDREPGAMFGVTAEEVKRCQTS